MRYNKAAIKRDTTGSRYQASTIVPKIPLNSNDQYIEVNVTDRLDLISHTFYGTRNYWWVIAAANNIGKGTLAIQQGAILRLPADPVAIANRLTGY
tara:strand:+ start:716 stop:1003 length:288 start_codon:yes stop_codon:yes gene_type:complete